MYIDTMHKHVIDAVVKDGRGETVGYRIENGEVVMKEQAVNMAKHGSINGVTVSKSKKGGEYLKSISDNIRSNNLENLPVINEDELK